MLKSDILQIYVARRFNVFRSTIVRLVRRVNDKWNVQDRPWQGVLRVTSARQDVFIRHWHLRNRSVCSAQSTSSAVIGNRYRTISRRLLRELGGKLTETFHDEWAHFPRYMLQNMCDSMRRRLQTVIDSQGGHTRYL
jgi:hypothetical protein